MRIARVEVRHAARPAARGPFRDALPALCGAWLCGLWLALAGPGAGRAADLPWLRAEGTRIVDQGGKAVVLRGANLGGWLVEEMWMMPIRTKPPAGSKSREVKDHVSLWRTIERRLGPSGRDRIRTALRDAWISEADFDRIRKAGMNCVRVPFTFDLLEEPDGFAWLDKALDRARGRGLYVILDLHGAPGRQSGEHHTGEAGVDRLFKDPANVERAERVWATVARRYRDRPEVAAYDLLNEPMGAPDVATLYLVQDRLYRAIRAVDARHLIIVEDGYKGIDSLPRPALAGWEGVVLSTHHYHFNAKSPEDQVKAADDLVAAVKKLQKGRPAPYILGEFQQEPHGTPATMARLVGALDREGLSWSVWTYKTAMKDGGGGMWGWYRSPKPLEALDPFRDSAADLLRKVEQVRTERLMEDTALTESFRQGRK
jgi:endoglucanase